MVLIRIGPMQYFYMELPPVIHSCNMATSPYLKLMKNLMSALFSLSWWYVVFKSKAESGNKWVEVVV